MTLEAVNRELEFFLSSKEPEVLCIRGKWGVGKTHLWNKAVESAKANKKIPFGNYSYISLFGLNSLAELRFSIFENQISLTPDDEKTNIDKLDSYLSSRFDWRKKAKFIHLIPGLKGITDSDAATALASLTTHEQLICIDDIERRGRDLDIKDVLGLASFLKEQRACKVVIILNEEELTDGDQQDFRESLEKVVDISIEFCPSAVEAAEAAFDTPDEVSKKVASKCVKLGITNIRVIRRIDRLVRAVQPMISEYSSEVFDTVVASVALFSWSNDQPTEAPSLDFIRSLSAEWAILASDEEVMDDSGSKASWKAKLEDYGYTWTDEFDLALMDGVMAGYFTPEKIVPHAKALEAKIVAARADGSFEKAWEAYHGSFANDADEVLDGIYESFKKNFNHITPLNVNGTVTLLKELGREDQAKELIDLYVNERDEGHSFFDLNEYAFAHDITDPDLRAAFDAKAVKLKPPQDFKSALSSIKDSWSEELLGVIAEAPLEKYLEVFKASSGVELRRLLSNAMQFSRISNPSPEMEKITTRTKAALKVIGKETKINARRVRRFGVVISDDDPADET
ncbi:P-loop NTPase fold protein [Leisingera sp. MMG026]|uniref:P-loop NTPase fold protein n=1 Tax=Leisingera sp. MMG026 TaxID=2909982 RepID=UPI0031CCD546|nr:KAP family NTPase [Leisingera sp. MMG026]